MLSILVTGANNEEGRYELRKFEEFLNRSFIIMHKSRVDCMKICYYKGKGAPINRATFNRLFNDINELESRYYPVAVTIQDRIYAQQQSNIIHQAGRFQGVNLIYAVDTKLPPRI